jgi:STE24 endopeptidase
MTATTTRRRSAHPPLGARTPARNEDFFDPDQLAELRAYSRPRKRVDLVAKVAVGAVDLALIFLLDLGPELDARVAGSPWPVRLVAVAGIFALISQIVLLPADWWATMVHDRRHGLSNQGAGLWAGDQVKGLLLNIVLSGLLLVPIFWAIRTFDTWWLVGGLVFLAIALFLNFVYPVLIMPRFNEFTPMEPGPLRTRIEEIADLAGTSIEGVYTMDGSKRSRRGNAFVAGFGPTKRVVVYDTMLDRPDGPAFTLEQIAQVVAHEIGHYRLNHIPKTFPLAGLQMLVALAFVQYVVGSDAVLGWAGVDELGDPGAAPLFLLGIGVPMAGLALLSAWVSRRNEREADLEALELLGDPSSFVAMWPSFVALNKSDLEPGWWERLNASHPGVAERMQFGLDWAEMNGVPAERPAVAAVPPTEGPEAESV